MVKEFFVFSEEDTGPHLTLVWCFTAPAGRYFYGFMQYTNDKYALKTENLRLTNRSPLIIIRTMTLFDDDRYDWRETYFVYFESAYRPKLPTVRHALRTHAPFLDVLHTKAEQDGRLVEMTIASYEDHAAMEIIYREGKDILAEARNFIEALKGDATAEETAKLQMIEQCKMRFDVHHFEQAADTRVFNTIKIPELKFPRQTTQPADQRDALAKALELNPPGKGKFYFDSQSYSRCRIGSEVNLNDDAQTDSNEMERVSPEMLITVLEILCRISRGTAIDPASGIIL